MRTSRPGYILGTLLAMALGVLLAWPAFGADKYVAKTGNNGNAGTQGSPWLTFDYGADHVAAGDTLHVGPGTYSERVTPSVTGTAGNYINYVADGAVIFLGADFNGVSYIRVIGFELTHPNTSTPHCFTFSGTASYIEILDNYGHNFAGEFTRASAAGTASYITVRGNHVYEMGIGTAGAFQEQPGPAVATTYLTANQNHWLVEYNHIHRAGDFVDIYGPYHIVRNNYLHDHDPAYWAPSGWHSDMFQPGSDGANLGTRHHVYEANFAGDSLTADSHVALFNDTVAAGDTNMLFRGNIGYNIGSVFLQVLNVDDVNAFNNTAYKMGQVSSGSSPFTWYGSGGNVPINGALINTIIQEKGLPGDCILIQDGTGITVSNNIGYNAGTEASYVSTSDPLLADPENRNFRIQSGSPARGAGAVLAAVTSSTGSGTSFNVTSGRGKYFCDGFGIVAGDVIRVGSTNATRVRITSISSDTFTVDASISWNNGDAVYWGDHGLDIGALPFYFQPLTSAALTQVGSDYTVTPDGDTRFAIFYLNGVPYAQVMSTNPRAALTQTMPAGTVTVKVYPLYAQATTEVTATSGGGGGGGTTTGRALGRRRKF